MAKNSSNQRIFTLNCNGRILVIDTPIVMGIINTTPDSFYSGSRFSDLPAIHQAFERMLNEGAAIIDIGGQSTRPGSETISVDEELSRVVPVIESLAEKFPDAIISIDTFYSNVLRAAVDSGASIANDVSAKTKARVNDDIPDTGAGQLCQLAVEPVEYVKYHLIVGWIHLHGPWMAGRTR